MQSLKQHFRVQILIVFCLIATSTFTSCNVDKGTSVRVEGFFPSGKTARQNNITIKFSRDIVLQDSTEKFLDVIPLKIEPPIPVKCMWVDRRTLRLYPVEPFAPSSRYTVSINPDIVGTSGLSLSGEKKFEFFTTPLSIVNASQYSEGNALDLTRVFLFRVEFSEIVTPEELKKNMIVQLDGVSSAIDYTIAPDAPSRQITVRTIPVETNAKSTNIKLKIKSGLLCTEGTVPLAKDFEQTFQLAVTKPLKVERVSASPVGSESYQVTVRFTDAVDAEVASKFIDLEPDRTVTWSGDWRSVHFTSKFDPGTSITINLRKGLRALSGASLEEDFSQNVIFGDRSPSLQFASQGSYLSRQGLKNVELEVINIEKIQIDVEKIYLNNIVYFLQGGRYSYNRQGNLGRQIYNEKITHEINRNQPTPVTVNFDEFLKGHPGGLFRLNIRQEDRYWSYDSRTVLLTDIGLIAKRTDDIISVYALSTQTLEPLAGVEVKLLSSTNQEIAHGITNGEGNVILSGLQRVLEEYTPFVVTAARNEDWSYLMFGDCEVSTSDFDVNGKTFLTHGIEAYLYTDRGVYRPGDTVHVASIMRGISAGIVESFPVRLEVIDPTGKKLTEQLIRNQTAGLAEYNIDIPAYAKTGRYVAKLFGAAEDPIGTVEFSVEEFMPDRMKVELTTDKTTYQTSESVKLDIKGVMLFGPPAAGRSYEASYTLKSVPFQPKGYSTYRFGLKDGTFKEISNQIADSKLDGMGTAVHDFKLPQNIEPHSALKCEIQVSVQETGGRAVTNFKTVDVHAYPLYIGLKQQQEGYGEIGQDQIIEFISLSPDGNPTTIKGLNANFYRITWTSALRRNSSGQYRYVSERVEKLIESKSVGVNDSKGTVSFLPPDWGSYRIELVEPASGSTSDIGFYVSGYGYSPWSMEQPERIDIELDKTEYVPGETAKVIIKAPFEGRLLLTVERNNILFSKSVMVEGNTSEFSIPVKAEYLPNVYITATLIRSQNSAEKHAPLRAYGTVPLYVNKQSHRLTLGIDVKNEARPLTPLQVNISVDRSRLSAEQKKNRVFVTVAAVDEGILQLTDFVSPDPMDFFYGKKRLNVRTYDIFSHLLPEVETADIHSSPSGDEDKRRSHLMPVSVRRVKPVALWSGIVEVDKQGRAQVRFDLPEFNGRLRIMAVASCGALFGGAQTPVTVRDQIVMTPTFPRFIAPSDKFTVPVMVYNGTGKGGNFDISLSTSGPVTVSGNASRKLFIPFDREVALSFQVEAEKAIGKTAFVLSASTADFSLQRTTEVPLRPAAPPISITGSGSVMAGEEALIFMPCDWIEGSASYRLNLMPFPAVEFAGSLQYLLRYPYGCVEQTTSRAFPLLYFNELAKAAEPQLFSTNAPEYYVREAINRLSSMQNSNGAFSFWPYGDYVSSWSSIYVMHFLVEAEKAGFTVSKSIIKRGLKHLKEVARSTNSVLNNNERQYGRNNSQFMNSIQTYSVYVLALAGEPQKSSMNYLMENGADKMSLDSRLFLAGAFALSGDLSSAYRLLPVAISPIESKWETGGSFSSSIRSNAIVLNILNDVSPDHPSIPVLVDYLSKQTKMGRWYTTQENAWALLAIGKVLSRDQASNYTGKVTISDSIWANIVPESIVISDSTLGGEDIKLSIRGEGRCYYFWEARGIPVGQRFEETDSGIQVRRSFLNENGELLQSGTFKHGDMIVSEITLKALSQQIENVVIDDMLPAGFEIENPRLKSRANISWLPKETLQPTYTDIRDDRMLLFVDLEKGKEYKYYYALRAVTKGEFTLPPVSAECMYNPGLKSVASSGIVKIIE